MPSKRHKTSFEKRKRRRHRKDRVVKRERHVQEEWDAKRLDREGRHDAPAP